jgi:hypothetical protein
MKKILLFILGIGIFLSSAQSQILPEKKLSKVKLDKGNNISKSFVNSFVETFDDSSLTNINGLPDNWSYTPNSPNVSEQFYWQNGYLTKGYVPNTTIHEVVYTPTYTVPSNPYLTFD